MADNDVDEDEAAIVKLAASMLDAVWAIAEKAGVCPLCVVDIMYDMVEEAEEAGKIKHAGAADASDEDDSEVHTIQ